MIGICGDNCTYCPRHIATQSGSVQELNKVKELWVRLGLREPDLSAQTMVCHGCLPENQCAYTELRSCVATKSFKNCGVCDEYPCNLINKAFDKSGKLKSYANEVCSQDELDLLHKAFFSKKEYFDCIQKNTLRSKKG